MWSLLRIGPTHELDEISRICNQDKANLVRLINPRDDSVEDLFVSSTLFLIFFVTLPIYAFCIIRGMNSFVQTSLYRIYIDPVCIISNDMIFGACIPAIILLLDRCTRYYLPKYVGESMLANFAVKMFMTVIFHMHLPANSRSFEYIWFLTMYAQMISFVFLISSVYLLDVGHHIWSRKSFALMMAGMTTMAVACPLAMLGLRPRGVCAKAWLVSSTIFVTMLGSGAWHWFVVKRDKDGHQFDIDLPPQHKQYINITLGLCNAWPWSLFIYFISAAVLDMAGGGLLRLSAGPFVLNNIMSSASFAGVVVLYLPHVIKSQAAILKDLVRHHGHVFASTTPSLTDDGQLTD